MPLRIKMIPGIDQVQRGESGIITIVRKYAKHFPAFDMELVHPDAAEFDVFAVHAGTSDIATPANVPSVAHCHGLYWTGMYNSPQWEWNANKDVINSIRHAHIVTVPSPWVGETIQRDMHRDPIVLPHGVDWDEWQGDEPKGGYVLGYAKNRAGQDVCNPDYLNPLAGTFPNIKFIGTFIPNSPMPNLQATGVIPYEQMKKLVKGSEIFVSCVRETFGISILEAMAAGLPILGWREGGIVDLVQHGVNGYLAEPGNFPDLFQGMDYCLENRKTLGANSREMAKDWTWEAVAEQARGIYEKAIEKAHQRATCAVIIPCYKYADKVGRAIESVMAQTYPQLTDIVVVDDCSPDEGATERVVKAYGERDKRIKFVRLSQNSTVAIARNTGISLVDTKYICCLDADDQITHQFLEACIPALEKDQSIGVSYAGLEAVGPDGRHYDTRWPPDAPLFDQQVAGKNQIPTCSVFRREMWEQLGGYRARYCPQGCGSEDAEFYLRAGANGWGMVKGTTARMFIYSLGGNTTGKKDYREPNWLSMHPWTKDKQHPVASLAPSPRGSHAARIYDTPAVSIVIPVGPGHETDIFNALDSLEAQDFRMWEVIVVLDGVDHDLIAPALKAYPYAHFTNTTHGPDAQPKGAGYARNLGASLARSNLLIFLDADDYFLPDALSTMLNEFGKGEAIVYGDCVAYAYVEDLTKLDSRMRRNVIEHDVKTHKTLIRFPSAEYDCKLAQSMPNSDDPDSLYLVAHVTCLIPKLWHEAIGGFDEDMISWEDVDWHWRLSKAGYCYRRMPRDIFMYQLGTGQRRQVGRQNWKDLLQYLKEKHKELPMSPCKSCGGGGRSTPPQLRQIMVTGEEVKQMVNDEDMVKVEYMHPNRGQHSVTGAATGTRYGYRSGGEIFFVRRADILAQPHYFRPVQVEVQAPKPETVAPPPPAPIANLPEPAPAPEPEEVVTESIPHDLIANLDGPAPEKPIENVSPFPPKPKIVGVDDEINVNLIPGVSTSIGNQLMAMNINTPRELLNMGIDGLQNLKGVGEHRAAMIIDYVNHMVKGDGEANA